MGQVEYGRSIPWKPRVGIGGRCVTGWGWRLAWRFCVEYRDMISTFGRILGSLLRVICGVGERDHAAGTRSRLRDCGWLSYDRD
ncbi:unnamed protein product [Arabidopsis halleri]